jgi:hypothetical protein
MYTKQGYIRKVVAASIVAASVALIIIIFWKHEMKYALPTPVPDRYTEVSPGENVVLPVSLQKGVSYFLHFYNPECPCSRFNARHIKSLIGNYHDSIRFVIVVTEQSSLKKARGEFGDDLHYLLDEDSSIAKACGVYSTPQAAIISATGKLFYRGNYNSARYCTTRASNFAELSLIALINNQSPPAFGLAATQSYGCELDESTVELF